MTSQFTVRVWALLLLAAGYGWAGGHFIPADAPLWAYAFQFVMLLLLFIFAVGFLKTTAGLSISVVRARRNIIALTVYAILTLLINAANIVRGALQGGPYGSHNTFADLIPIMLIMAGDVLWLLTLIRKTAKTAKTSRSGKT